MKNEHRTVSAVLLLSVILAAAALITGCPLPTGTGGTTQLKNTASGVQPMAVTPQTLLIQETVNPAQVYLKGSGLGVESTTVTIGVTGYGGTTTTAVPMDIILAIDSSGSMTTNDQTNLRLTAAKSFVDKLNPTRDRAAVVSWDDGIDFTYPSTSPYPNPSDPGALSNPPNPVLPVTSYLTTDFAALKSQIDTIDANGNTNLAMGLQQGIRMLDASQRTGAVAAIIFLTDGLDTSGWQSTILTSWITYAKSKGYRIYSVGLGSGADVARLQNMATQTGGVYYSAPTAANLQALYDQIYKEVVSITAPSGVNVVEVTPSYIVGHGSFSVTPDSVVTNSSTGETTLTWLDVGKYVGNKDSRLSSDEVFQVSFTASSTKSGTDLAVNAAAAAVTCLDPTGAAQSQTLPQTLITVIGRILVKIDIEPWCRGNDINMKRDEIIPVAVLSSDTFDARTLDPATVTFAGAHALQCEKTKWHGWRHHHVRHHTWDVNRDGKPDAVFFFHLDDTTLTLSSTEGVLQGATVSGLAVEGKDFVHMLDSHHWGRHWPDRDEDRDRCDRYHDQDRDGDHQDCDWGHD
ncbi:MAG TPA: vWA domain-containing protein [Spirochaetia bacterium]|nr:vWA domain-containing protein [Spirochaetia bacterium]